MSTLLLGLPCSRYESRMVVQPPDVVPIYDSRSGRFQRFMSPMISIGAPRRVIRFPLHSGASGEWCSASIRA
jgi:hypothetical protein